MIVDSIPCDEICVLTIGGDGTRDNQGANGFAKMIGNELAEKIGKEIPCYGVTYDFAGRDTSFSRRLSFIKNRACILTNDNKIKSVQSKAQEEDYTPEYIDELFEKAILPRISLHNGKGKLSTDIACKRIRKLNIVTHCHGGYVAKELENRMQQKMKELGYNASEMSLIQSQMLIVAHSPACALGNSKSQFVSFISARDGGSLFNIASENILNTYIQDRLTKDNIHRYGKISNNKELIEKNSYFNLEPCYFPQKQGNLFMIKEKFDYDEVLKSDEGLEGKEHDSFGFNTSGQTNDGKLLNYLRSSVICNGVENSLQQNDDFVPLPPIDKLILRGNDREQEIIQRKFQIMTENGREIRHLACQYGIKYHSRMLKNNHTKT